jgi:hypothetical protein
MKMVWHEAIRDDCRLYFRHNLADEKLIIPLLEEYLLLVYSSIIDGVKAIWKKSHNQVA